MGTRKPSSPIVAETNVRDCVNAVLTITLLTHNTHTPQGAWPVMRLWLRTTGTIWGIHSFKSSIIHTRSYVIRPPLPSARHNRTARKMAAFFTRARQRVTTTAASIVTGSVAVLLTSTLTRDDKEAHAQAHQANDLHKWSQVGLPAFDTTYMFRENFVICYDSRTRNPKWVMERLTKETCTGEADRRVVAFYEEGSVDPRFRSKNSDYLNSGYDRGHMAPAANNRSSAQTMEETFSLANVSPQVGGGFNRDYWARFVCDWKGGREGGQEGGRENSYVIIIICDWLTIPCFNPYLPNSLILSSSLPPFSPPHRVEKYSRDLTKHCASVYLVSGPLFLPQRRNNSTNTNNPASKAKFFISYELLGEAPSLVAVPTHFFKCVYAEMKDGRKLLAAFVLPNAPIPADVPLRRFLVPLENLEQAAGFRLFVQALTEEEREGVDARVLALRGEGGKGEGEEGGIEGLLMDGKSNGALMVRRGGGGRGGGGGGGGGLRLNLDGPEHLCDVLACQLPPEKFWEINGGGNGKGKGKRKNGSNGGGGGGKEEGEATPGFSSSVPSSWWPGGRKTEESGRSNSQPK